LGGISLDDYLDLTWFDRFVLADELEAIIEKANAEGAEQPKNAR
jgi:hypothetical protein